MKKYLLVIPFLFLESCVVFQPVFKLQHEMDFEINSSVANFSGSKVLDPTTNEEFKKNIDKIKDIQIARITITVSNFQGPDTQTINASFDFADANGNNKQNLSVLPNKDVKSFVDKETNLDVTNDRRAKIAEFLKASPNKLIVYNSGTLNQVPAKFNVKLKFYNEVTVSTIAF